jgi:carboxynorspermidine decarboxylase
VRAIDATAVPDSPCWVIDMEALEANLALLASVQERAGGKILLALKGFAAWRTFGLVGRYLAGAAASTPHEARLARAEMRGEVHVCAPAYTAEDVAELVTLCDHIVFNSFEQWRRFRPLVADAAHRVSCGLRINPEHREVGVALYDPCAPGSRLGVTRAEFRPELLDGLEGLHFHTLCQLGSDALDRTLVAVEEKFGAYLARMRWINLGGGHHITAPGYDVEHLVALVRALSRRYTVDVYLEPGEAIAVGTGALVATVLDVIRNDGLIAILDTSATAHMPDVLEMPYRPEVVGGAAPGVRRFTYRLGGVTCLAGDVIGTYSFDHELRVGDRLTFLDMAHYTMVKTTNFNGVRLPSIALRHRDGSYELVKRFGYDSYRDRLG